MKFNKIMEYLDEMTWNDVKNGGSDHYKNGKSHTEPIDLYVSMGTFNSFALSSIIKYAARSTSSQRPINQKDLDKIIHYACLLKAQGKE